MWRKAARCRGFDPHLFDADRLPGETNVERTERHDTAAAICRTCPVAQACLDDALNDPHREGIYAGYVLTVERPE